MIQRARKLPGAIAPCPCCGKQPFVVEQARLVFLECPPCGSRTAKRETLQEAVASWEASETVETSAIRRSA